MRGIAADNKPQSLECLQEQEHLFEHAARLNPKNADAWARLSRAILLQSIQHHIPVAQKENSLVRGAAAAEKAISLDAGNARAHLAVGLTHALRGDFERALLAYEAALALDRNLAQAHNNLGNCHLHLGQADEAVRAVEAALRLDPRGPQLGVFWTTLGFARLLQQRFDEASSCFSRALAANSRLTRGVAGAAVAAAMKGDIVGAKRAADELLRMSPDYCLSQTIDACLPGSPVRYREFYDEVLRPGAELAGIPV